MFFSKTKLRMLTILRRVPVIGYAVESSSWIVGILKRVTQNSIGWITILEDQLPDVGVPLLVIGVLLFLMGSTVTLKDSWPSFFDTTNCPRCLAGENRYKMATPQDETLAKRDVELSVPIFKFVKVFPYHKRFSGTTDFSLNSVKMKLIIQFNRATQTSWNKTVKQNKTKNKLLRILRDNQTGKHIEHLQWKF